MPDPLALAGLELEAAWPTLYAVAGGDRINITQHGETTTFRVTDVSERDERGAITVSVEPMVADAT